MNEGIAKYLEHLKSRNYATKSLEMYSYCLGKFIDFAEANGIERVQDVDLKLLESFRLHLIQGNCSERTVAKTINVVRQFFSWLESQGIVFLNPAVDLANIKLSRKLQYVPSWNDFLKVLNQIDVKTPEGIRTRAMLETCGSCALRRAELLGMNVFDVDFHNGIVKIRGKGRKERMLPLTSQAVHWINRYVKESRPKLLGENDVDEQAMWLTTQRARMTVSALNGALRRCSIRAKLKRTMQVHQIRRLVATEMLRNGAHPVQIQHLLGHSTMKSLSDYLKITITDLRMTHSQSKVGK